MSLVSVVLVLIVVGVLLWLINNYIPMDGKIKNILNAALDCEPLPETQLPLPLRNFTFARKQEEFWRAN